MLGSPIWLETRQQHLVTRQVVPKALQNSWEVAQGAGAFGEEKGEVVTHRSGFARWDTSPKTIESFAQREGTFGEVRIDLEIHQTSSVSWRSYPKKPETFGSETRPISEKREGTATRRFSRRAKLTSPCSSEEISSELVRDWWADQVGEHDRPRLMAHQF